jgi:alkylation response protein AidB-like acyl-CoA dehydrogenase
LIDLSLPDEARAVVARLEEFIAGEVAPAEAGVTEADLTSGAVERGVLPALRAAARRAGVYAPQLPPEWGGQGLGATALALIAERCGPHPLAALALNCAAPDEANLHLLLHFGTPEQRERWLRPLADGAIRSCFGMTEPDAGSDPRRISSTAVPLPGGGWRINAHKLFTTGAIGAAFCIVMAVSEPDAPPGRGISMFIVPTDTPGFEVVRDLHMMGFACLGGHPEITLRDVVVGPEALLGERAEGFAMAQARLGTGRIGHAMRWIGIAQRALDLAATHALGRETFGAPLAERQAVQWWLADGATRLHAARLMVLEACWRIERGLPHATQVSMVKTFTAELLGEIVDQALQVHGGRGYTDDLPLARWYRDARAARIYDGPSEVHRMAIARRLLREVAETGGSRRTTGDPLLRDR